MLILALVLVMLASLACSLGKSATPTVVPSGGDEQATTEPGGEATEAPGDGGAPNIDSEAISQFDSYRLHMVVEWTPEGGDPETQTIDEEFVKEPPAQRWVMSSADGDVEMVQIGSTSWMCSAGSCIQSESTEDASSLFGDALIDPASFAADSTTTLVGQETVGGINTRHYSLNLTAAELALLTAGSDISNVQADMWVADESGLPEFVVRYATSWTETREDVTGIVSYLYELSDVNQPITIEQPEGASGFPEDVPEYAGATDLLTMEGLITFTTTDDAATVADFYRSELPGMGWTSQSDDEFSGTISQSWGKDGKTLSLLVSPQDAGGSSVMITIQ
jgi:hypothetical protein